MKDMKKGLIWLKINKPDSLLREVYELCVEKNATLSLDTMWRLKYKNQYYDCNSLSEVINILREQYDY